MARTVSAMTDRFPGISSRCPQPVHSQLMIFVAAVDVVLVQQCSAASEDLHVVGDRTAEPAAGIRVDGAYAIHVVDDAVERLTRLHDGGELGGVCRVAIRLRGSPVGPMPRIGHPARVPGHAVGRLHDPDFHAVLLLCVIDHAAELVQVLLVLGG